MPSSIQHRFFVAAGLALLTGCAAHRPPVTDVRDMETHLVASDERSVFDACVGTLQDMGYTLESSDSYGGVLTASRFTQNPSDAMPPASSGEKKRMPVWEKVALVATGVVLVVGAAALITHDSDDGKHKAHVAPSDSTRGRQLPQHDHDTAERRNKRRHHGSSEPPTVLVGFSGSAPEPPKLHEYLITIHLQDRGEAGTHVRASLEDTEYQGSEVIRSGPVDDPGFYARFFAALDQSLGDQPEVQAAAR
jgi:hypothetical protein